MNKAEIISKLNEITSYYSFGRILGYIELKENTNFFSKPNYVNIHNKDRLINNEIAFLYGLWLHNCDINKENQDTKYDYRITSSTYYLLDKFHQIYKQKITTPLGEQLKEISFYEGDEAYDEQFIEIIPLKYSYNRNWLVENKNIDVDLIPLLFKKIKNQIESQIKYWARNNQETNCYYYSINAYTIEKEFFFKFFTDDEQNIINSITFTLGKDKAQPLNDIGDENSYIKTPIIKLPNGNYFISNFSCIARALNEMPYLWLVSNNSYSNGNLGNERGTAAEDITHIILKTVVPQEQIFRNIGIKENKNDKTDIDVLIRTNETAIVFQVKGKGLTMLSRNGNFEKIKEDYNDAIAVAYNQGVTSISCLREYNQYKFSQDIGSLTNLKSYYNVCIVLDAFPTISSLVYCFTDRNNKIPLIAMSVFDLDIIISRLGSFNELISYIKFRAKFSIYYALNEMVYLGAYLDWIKRKQFRYCNNTIDKTYANEIDDWYYNGKIE